METKADSDMRQQPKYDAYILDIHLSNSKSQRLFETKYRHAYQIVWPDTVGVFQDEDPGSPRPFDIIEGNLTNRIRYWLDDSRENPTVEIWTKGAYFGNKRITLFNKMIGTDKFLLGNELNEKIMDMDLRGDRYRMIDVLYEKFPCTKNDGEAEGHKKENHRISREGMQTTNNGLDVQQT